MANQERHRTISDEVVAEGGKLVLAFFSNTRQARFSGGKSRVAEFDLAFFEVQGYNRVNYRGLDLRDSNGNTVSPLSPQSGRDYDRLYDPEGNDIFRVETNENPWQITQASVSVLQDNVRIYPRIPETETQPGWTWAVGDEPSPTAGDDFGFTAGGEMDYDTPPASLQAVGFESGDNSTIQYGFYNRSQHRGVVPRLNVVGRTYRTVPITKTEEQRKAMKKALDDTSAAQVLTFGPVTDNFTINLPDDWEEVDAVRDHVGPLSQFGGGS